MDIRVSGHQLETGDALRTHVESRLGGIADKYFSKALSAQATVGRAPHDKFSCDIIVHVMQGLILKGRIWRLMVQPKRSKNSCAAICAACKTGMNRPRTRFGRKRPLTPCSMPAMSRRKRRRQKPLSLLPR